MYNLNVLKVSGFEDYVKLFSTNTNVNVESFTVPFYCNVNERWQIAVARSNTGYHQISFVNNINTLKVSFSISMKSWNR